MPDDHACRCRMGRARAICVAPALAALLASALAALLGALAAALLAAAPATAGAQEAAGGAIARTFELRARDGLARQLDEGYRRHLDWHAAAGDPWSWYLWQVTNGERAGLYVDGTFGHAWGDFDAAVDPPGDAADNAMNVNPFAARAASQVWRRRPDLEPAAAASLDFEQAPYVMRSEYRVRPGAEAAFADSMRRLRAAAGARAYALFELVSGGEPATYVVWAPAASWSDAGAFAERTAESGRALADAAARVRAELWRFRPDLSICRTAAARCHRTLEERASAR
ncbi:MAG TPA: hypothetical protein VFS05_11505 [Gemmatimonadaceae bacterium]|nr:hypothetical protein [Gemmatimonadaceae bacterium]